MSEIATEIIFVLLLIIANGVFSGSEIAVISSRKVRLEQAANQGNAKARVALKLAQDPNDFLSTVQIGITLIGVLSGAVAGATIAARLAVVLDAIPFLQPYKDGLSVGIVVGMITFLSLVIGELLPKRIALNAPEQIACTVAKPMRLLSKIASPLVYLLSISTDLLLKVLGIKASDEPSVTEEEIKMMIRQGADAGMFEESEQEMLERIFRLGDRSVKSLMTPRTEIVWLNVESPLAENLDEVIKSSYSRFPVGRDSIDQCLGIVRGSSLLSACLADQNNVSLESLIQSPVYVAESTRALKLLEQFKQTGVHIALVTDEYGGVEGLVTLNDLMEAIVGDLPSLENQDAPPAVQREDGSWLLDGLLSIDEFRDILKDEISLPQIQTDDYHTLGGFVMHSLKHIPRVGEYFEWNDLKFEVMDMDGTRVDKVMVSKSQPKALDIKDDR
ncbi:HlyC/CorC family transporter (plasmid) [Pseudanabaena biceps]|nr:HlyC/CorC family transporter [Pseudanabaena biceps]